MAASLEDTLDALVAKLTADLPAKIAAINTAVTDGHTLDNPHKITMHAVGELEGYPTIMVLPDESEETEDTGHYVLVQHRIQVIAFLQDWDTEALARKVLRFQKAIKEVLLSSRNPGNTTAGYTIKWKRDQPGPLFRPEGKTPFIQGERSIFRVLQEQRIG